MNHKYENERMTLSISIGELASGNLLKNKVVMITGGTSGIGYELAKKCLKQGASVIISGTNEDRLKAVKHELGCQCATICFNMLDIASFDKVLKEATTHYGPIDCIVNNAGISLHEGDFMNVTEQTWNAQFDVNLKGPYFLTQAWLRYYRENSMKSGRVLMMASDTSGMGSSIPYGLSKAGIASLTRGLAKKLSTEGIRINALAPGTTLTPMTDDFTHGEVCRETTIGKRALFPQEIAEIGVFLLSDLSTAISGNIFGCSEANICFDNPYFEAETNP